MPRSVSFLVGLVVSILVGGIAGAGVAALVGAGGQGQWLPSQGTAIGVSVAAAIGFVVAWLMIGRSPRAAVDQPTSVPDSEPATIPPPAEPMPPARPSQRPPTATIPGALLAAASVRLAGTASTRAEAIDEAGALLVEAGAVDSEYVAAMHAREKGTSSHMGNALAVPRGSHDARSLVQHSALALVRYPVGLDWHGNRVRFVVAIAGVDDSDQVRLVSRVAEVFLDDAAVARLETTEDPDDVVKAFAAGAH